ncbi:hypothetical protein, partial [uncultured Senegalimassilia sp.]|uniref:hypothetical protein n=1 Tax=uncultured Senegalimassilia sp. TaxID=1714350 RepID=UPI00258DAB0E
MSCATAAKTRAYNHRCRAAAHATPNIAGFSGSAARAVLGSALAAREGGRGARKGFGMEDEIKAEAPAEENGEAAATG